MSVHTSNKNVGDRILDLVILQVGSLLSPKEGYHILLPGRAPVLIFGYYDYVSARKLCTTSAVDSSTSHVENQLTLITHLGLNSRQISDRVTVSLVDDKFCAYVCPPTKNDTFLSNFGNS